MKARRVTALKRLLRKDNVNVKRIEVAAHEKKEDMVYIFFDNVEEETAKDKAVLEELKEAAKEVAKDTVYPNLTNAKQRELYLLDRYGLSKRAGVNVIELLKIAEIAASVAMDERLLTARVTGKPSPKAKEEKKEKKR